jgi:pyruvate dehydrogenase E2 component (dihydrolipoamide acetyltransferase)
MLDIILPEVGEGITSGTIIGIAVKVGDAVKTNQDLMEIETDKASLPVPSPADGVIKEILINDGDDVAIGSVIMRMEAGVTAEVAPVAPPVEEPKSETPQPAPTTKAKVQAAPKPAVTAPSKKSNAAIPAQKSANASPSVRKMARELGLEVSLVTGSGSGGRITQDDVKKYVKQALSSSGGTTAGQVSSKPLPNFDNFGTVHRERMSKIRQVTSNHMAFCWNTIPHVTQFDKADITDLDKLRKQNSTEERKLTVTPFLMKVMAAALKKFPEFNASIDVDNNEIIYKDYLNIGVAVDTDRGLLVPVVRDVDKLSVLELTDELNTMAQKARDKKTLPNDLQGGSMTLTNLGGIGGHAFTPIVNWPEVCILGVSRGGFEPVWNGREFEPRNKLPLSLSYDHRVIDGASAARFLRWICTAIEQPFMMELA